MKKIVAVFFVALLFIGCSQTEAEYDKPADYWYESMLKEIRFGNLEGADDRLASLQSEHINSPLIKEAMLILANAHMDEKEYILAGFYFDEYLKRFGNAQNRPFIAYMKIKANYYAFERENVNQQLLLESIAEAEEYHKRYPSSPYRAWVDSMLVNFYLGQQAMNLEIARIYNMRDAHQAADIYRNELPFSWVREIKTEPAKIAWYRKLFNW
ncbi:outer membrane protein assembly factor BamD [Helicobacter monodelphidis]|uniref:outer membrane protein assembly factor BamD n=1 Tax=Helicobacter sp. 15-1451 TaxID=2004995 RepID=UPI000DCC9D01|nr:outer membrane protein assembly factor BamD [Helicobacter sp. 15-1451]RAX57917.1 outer membrane protein assembly factor BamD [Helicobacter sp. 15-1451]